MRDHGLAAGRFGQPWDWSSFGCESQGAVVLPGRENRRAGYVLTQLSPNGEH